MPAAVCCCDVAQQDSAEVGVHGLCERLEVLVQEGPGAQNKERAQLSAGNVRPQAPPFPTLRVSGLQVLPGNGGPRTTGLPSMVLLLLSSSMTMRATLHGAQCHDPLLSFDSSRDSQLL